MRNTIFTGLFLLLSMPFAHARGGSFGNDSFRASCDVVYEDGGRIQAQCRNRRGQFVYNDFDRRGCIGDIANDDGFLTCERGHRLPPGSYLESCSDCRVRGPILECACRDTRGRDHRAVLDLRQCGGAEIANINGNLVCN